jgi:hypothetical protein
VIPPERHVPLLFILALAACGSGGPPPIPDAAGTQVTQVTLLRWPVGGGTPALYRFPTLAPARWEAHGTTPALTRVVGVDLDQGQAYALDRAEVVYALDLESGRARPFLRDVVQAASGPDGVVYAVATDRTLSSVARRLPNAYPGKLPAVPVGLVGTGSDQVYALFPGDSGLVVATQSQAPRRLPFPAAHAVHAPWGDIFAAGTADGVALLEPGDRDTPPRLDVGGKPQGLAFSPSGHRLYVTVAGDAQVQSFDRYTWRRVARWDLPGDGAALRPDPMGRFLLVRPADGDSIWVVDVIKGELLASWNTGWKDDLPTVAGGRWLLVREGADVVAYDLLASDLKESGRVKKGAADLWQVLDWSPRTEAAVAAGPDTAAAAPAAPTAVVYVQLSSSQNPAWAEELSSKLKRQGLPASVIRPRKSDEFYRVVLGPYPSREAADSAGTRLGQPYFLYLPEDR